MSHWTGEEERIFRLSADTCAGYEIGWSFVDTMLNVGCNFSAFCKNTTSTYQLINEESKFMGPTTFRKWFFAWASSQNIEFRQQCPGCGPEPVVLAGDGTRIGIKASAKNTTPIERYGNQEPL